MTQMTDFERYWFAGSLLLTSVIPSILRIGARILPLPFLVPVQLIGLAGLIVTMVPAARRGRAA
jgi:hypothetical protein